MNPSRPAVKCLSDSVQKNAVSVSIDGMRVPLIDLQAQHRNLRPHIEEAIHSVLEEGAFIGGSRVESFENAFALTLGAKHCIGVGNGTDALTLSLKALGI